MLRPIELSATPDAGLFGNNSVHIVVTNPNRIMLLAPMKKPKIVWSQVQQMTSAMLDTIKLTGTTQCTPFSTTHP